MPEYSLSIKNKMNLSDYSKVYDYINLANNNDSFVVTLNEDNINDMQIICYMMQNNNFDVSLEDRYEDEQLRIMGYKKRTP
ncbi:hypothetical protein Z968_09495 [Clostridium novyi A str. 4552]|uniref:Uncharacterized protein n=1 Tax=Clostridium novyi A str. 4552 TaxID=1444289 RepID=A0A0A0I3W9_CLONO|nr:hypothetical protein [Clostridium novyi]KGM95303.1 hypothetical protein Z968_09495 [Clostridium novyi A str. 4552]